MRVIGLSENLGRKGRWKLEAKRAWRRVRHSAHPGPVLLSGQQGAEWSPLSFSSLCPALVSYEKDALRPLWRHKVLVHLCLKRETTLLWRRQVLESQTAPPLGSLW